MELTLICPMLLPKLLRTKVSNLVSSKLEDKLKVKISRGFESNFGQISYTLFFFFSYEFDPLFGYINLNQHVNLLHAGVNHVGGNMFETIPNAQSIMLKVSLFIS